MRLRKCTLPVLVVLGLWFTACGGSSSAGHPGSRVGSSSSSPIARIGDYDGDDYDSRIKDADNDDRHTAKDGDNDFDNSTGSYYDADDAEVRDLGRAARPRDAHAIAKLVKRYMAAAAGEVGAEGCRMVAPSLVDSIVETLGKPPGPPYYRGKTCAEVLSRVFEKNHAQLASYIPTLAITGVRVAHNVGVAVLAFKGLPGRQLRVVKQKGRWWLSNLLDLELP